MDTDEPVEELVRTRLRSLRQSLGWSLDQLAERSHLSASTISRIETGKRTISIDVLIALARGLQVDLDTLLDLHHDDDVVIRPLASHREGATTWPLSRPTGTTAAIKMRLEPTDAAPRTKVHPGHDWFFVLTGRIRLVLGDRQIIVEAGEAAEFSTMTPHAIDAIDGPAELVMVFDREGQRAHLHTDDG
jgi:transcriptional regulator with XRE-family HTH domain